MICLSVLLASKALQPVQRVRVFSRLFKFEHFNIIIIIYYHYYYAAFNAPCVVH